ncbi:MAG: nitrile hydratase accessory protein [Proteobacteria bacterium]|nr:nitrile hydratase accessory protein [Pseudomonadota bacterium]
MSWPDDAGPAPLLREDRPVFSEPWEAQALAMAAGLQEAGHFTATEWAETLGAEIRRAQAAGDTDDGTTYYNHVLAALERLTTEKGLTEEKNLVARKWEWAEAYRNTPHGQPVELARESES